MKKILLERLRCPQSGQALTLENVIDSPDDIMEGWLSSADKQYRYPIRNGIPRFVPESNYADNFGMQWNHFSKTQLDSYSGHPISAERFWKATDWNPDDMKMVALDYSSAVDVCYANFQHHPNLHVVQGDIYALPFVPNSFAFVYSLGVLQHTPDVAKAFTALPPMVRAGGQLCVDYYEKSFKSRLLPKYWLRPLTKRMDKQRLFSLVQRAVPVLLPISRILGRIPVAGKLLRRAIPVANYEGMLPLTDSQLHEWAILDTFDWLSPAYDNPQTATTARLLMEQAGLRDIEVLKAGHLVARGRKFL